MAYQTAAILMTLSDPGAHSPTASLYECDFRKMCCGWQGFNCHSASRGLSATAQLLIVMRNGRCSSLQGQCIMEHLIMMNVPW